MAITIKLNISRAENKQLMDFAKLLAYSGYRGIYFTDFKNDTYIIIQAHQGKLSKGETDKIRGLILQFDPEANIHEITTEWLLPNQIEMTIVSATLEHHIANVESSDPVVRDIRDMVMRAKRILGNSDVNAAENFYPGFNFLNNSIFNYASARPKRNSPSITSTYEDMLIAADRLFSDLRDARLPLDNLLLSWRQYFCSELLRAEPRVIEVMADDNSAVIMKLDVVDNQRVKRFYQENLAEYYNDINAVFNEIVYQFSYIGPSVRHYEPATTDSATLTFNGCNVTRRAYAIFCFDIQRALLACGFFNTFILSVEYLRTADSLLSERIQLFVEKYELDVLSQEVLERALRKAAANNFLEDAELLLNEFHVNIDAQDMNLASKRTALHLAVERGHVGMIDFLLKHNARDNIPDANGNTANSLATADTMPQAIKDRFKMPVEVILTL